jgi:hypothetical protein
VNIPLTNGNADAVKVSRIASSCKCVALEFPEAIAAGANGAIEAEIAITEGPGTATITVETNNGIGQIELTWFGASVVRALPPRIHAISRVAGSTLERFFQLRCQGAVGDFEILEITPSDEWLNCFVASSPSTLLDEQYGVAGDQQAATLRLSVDTSKLGIGRRSAVIRIRTRVSQSQNEISIPVAVFLTD